MRKGKIVSVIDGKKTCNICDVEYPISYFKQRVYPSGSVGYKPYCTDCDKKYSRKLKRLSVMSEEQKKKKSIYMKEYYAKNAERLRPTNKKRAWGWYHMTGKNRYIKPEWRYKIYMSSASRAGRKFDIDKDTFLKLINEKCFYCGEEKELRGLDRADNNLDYTVENVVPCCKKCNFMKRTLNQSDFVRQCKKVANYKTM